MDDFYLSNMKAKNDLDVFTLGDYLTEEESQDAFAKYFMEHAEGLFTLQKEVDCFYDKTSREMCRETGRIDFVAIPTQKVVDLGWRAGVFGIECKRGGEHLGRLMLQCIDYRLARHLVNGFGKPIPLSTIVMWETQTIQYTAASICDNWRLATLCRTRSAYQASRVDIKLGGQTWLAMQFGEMLDRQAATDSKGYKVGNRS